MIKKIYNSWLPVRSSWCMWADMARCPLFLKVEGVTAMLLNKNSIGESMWNPPMEAGSAWKIWGNFSWGVLNSENFGHLCVDIGVSQWGTGGFSRLMVNKESPWASAKNGKPPSWTTRIPPDSHWLIQMISPPRIKMSLVEILCCSISLRRISWVIVIILIFCKLGRGDHPKSHSHQTGHYILDMFCREEISIQRSRYGQESRVLRDFELLNLVMLIDLLRWFIYRFPLI